MLGELINRGAYIRGGLELEYNKCLETTELEKTLIQACPLHNRFHHGYTRIKNIHLNKITRTSNDGAGDTKERGSKLSVPLRKHHKY